MPFSLAERWDHTSYAAKSSLGTELDEKVYKVQENQFLKLLAVESAKYFAEKNIKNQLFFQGRGEILLDYKN